MVLVLVGLMAGNYAGGAAEREKLYPRRTPIVEVYQKVQPAVVNISSSRVVTVSWGGFGTDIFGEIFQLPGPFERKKRLTSLGSGHRGGRPERGPRTGFGAIAP